MAFDNNSYQTEYKRQHYDTIRALVPKGRGNAVKALAKEQGKSVSQVIVEALEGYWKIDLSE